MLLICQFWHSSNAFWILHRNVNIQLPRPHELSSIASSFLSRQRLASLVLQHALQHLFYRLRAPLFPTAASRHSTTLMHTPYYSCSPSPGLLGWYGTMVTVNLEYRVLPCTVANVWVDLLYNM